MINTFLGMNVSFAGGMFVGFILTSISFLIIAGFLDMLDRLNKLEKQIKEKK